MQDVSPLAEADDLTLDKVMSSEPKEVTDQQIMLMVNRFRRERALFIEAGEKKPKKVAEEEENVE